MAQNVTITTVDDLDRANGVETPDAKPIRFGLDGVGYEIDLAADNEGKLRSALADYIAKARKATGAKGKSVPTDKARVATPGSRYTRAQLAEIRQWAINNGARCGDRGRLPADVVTAWEDNRNTARLPRSEVLANA